MKRARENYKIEWSVVSKSNTNMSKSGQCNLCMEEKYQISMKRKEKNDGILLNKRSELVSKCRHSRKKRKR